MRKDLGNKMQFMPLPVLMLATYDQDGKANVMNAAWGGFYYYNQVYVSLSKHKTTDNLELKKAFTLSFATKKTEKISDYFGVVSGNKEEVIAFARRCGFPVVAKVVGPVHKSDVGGVVLNIKGEQHLALEFDRMMQIPEAHAIMVQPMLKGTELFIGAKYEEKFGHVVLCGLGGIFVEVLKDVSSGLAPLSYEEAYSMIHSLRAYKIIQGTRGQKGVNEDKFAEIIVRLSTLLRFATEIKEMDINPLLATEKEVIAVDARIRIEKGE